MRLIDADAFENYVAVELINNAISNSDLISRQAALDALGEAPEVWTDSPEEFAALNQWEMDVTAIEAVPSADRPSGHWIDIIDIDIQAYTRKVRCNKCGHQRSMMSTQGVYPNFCENCGADMRGGNHDV